MKIVPVDSSTSGMLCDAADYEALSQFRWRLMQRGKHAYARTSRDKRDILAHRHIMGLEVGDPRVVDHINSNGLDNRRENLRVVSTKENAWNRQVTNALSRTYGVRKLGGSFVAKFVHEGQVVYLGAFETMDEAAFAVNQRLDVLRPGYGMRNVVDKAALRMVLTARIEALQLLLTEVGDE